MGEDGAPRRARYLFWVILGALSTALPEVTAGSDLYPFFKAADYLLVIPLYSLHILVLWYVVWRGGRPRLYNLFPAGALFGLYEAYLTKVIWSPTWAAEPFSVFGVAVVETLVLVLFWHSFLAFIVPLLVAETSLTCSREIAGGLPEWLGGRLARLRGGYLFLVFPFVGGLFQSVNTHSIWDAVFSGLTSTVIVVGLVYVWRRRVGCGYTLRSLLPTRREFRVLLALLLLLYGLMGVFWRPEALPGLGPQLAVWALYLFFGGLLYLGLRKSRVDESGDAVAGLDFSPSGMLLFGAVFTLGSLLGEASGLSFVAVYGVWVGGIVLGLYVLVYTARSVLSTVNHMLDTQR